MLKNGKKHYSHSALTPVVVSLDHDSVIPLVPEFIHSQDGSDKQDYEVVAAAKRWMERELGHLPAQITFLGDVLYCKQLFCSLLKDKGKRFILVCKPDSHKTLYEWLEDFERSGHIQPLEKRYWTGKQHVIERYRFVNEVPLRDSDKPVGRAGKWRTTSAPCG